ncbi:MAG: hypothetical protein ACK56I_34465 [bacterium]
MVGGGLVVLDVEEAAEGGPQGGGELGPAVRCDDLTLGPLAASAGFRPGC